MLAIETGSKGELKKKSKKRILASKDRRSSVSFMPNKKSGGVAKRMKG